MTTKNGRTPKSTGKTTGATEPWVKPLSAATAKGRMAPAKASAAASPDSTRKSAPAPAPAKSAAKKAQSSKSEARQPAVSEPAAKAAAAKADAVKPARPPKAEPEAARAALDASIGPAKALFDGGLNQARTLFSSARASRQAWSGSLAQSASEASKGFVEINGKLLDLMRAQTDAALSLWRAMLGVGSVGEAVELQTSELRKQFETTASHMKDIAATTSRVARAAMQPMRAAVDEATQRAS